MVTVTPEADLVARFDPQFVAQLLGDHDLTLRPDPVSHTPEYNSVGNPLDRAGSGDAVAVLGGVEELLDQALG